VDTAVVGAQEPATVAAWEGARVAKQAELLLSMACLYSEALDM